MAATVLAVWCHRVVSENGGRQRYRGWAADRRADVRACRPKTTKLSQSPGLVAYVENGLELRWSPEQISRRIIDEFGDDPDMRVSPETIYKELFVQGRGSLRKELAKCLRSGRARRRPRTRRNGGEGKIVDKVMISERPAEAEDRAVPGHWEGDLILGKDGRSAIGTLVERSTRFVMLLRLEGDHSAGTVRDAMAAKIVTLHEALRRSITWDQGTEMAQHAQFTIDTGVQIYFCDPHSPGSAARMRTPTDCSASTSPRAPTCRSTPTPSSTPSPTNSTAGHAKPSTGRPHLKHSTKHSLRWPLNPRAYLSSRRGNPSRDPPRTPFKSNNRREVGVAEPVSPGQRPSAPCGPPPLRR